MKIILKNKDGAVLHTANKYCDEDISVGIETQEVVITPSKEEQIQEGLLGKVTVQGVTPAIDENIKSENIKSGITILGVEGGYEGIDTSDATALSEDILQNKTAYVNNEKITGTMQEYDGSYTGNGETGNEWEAILASSIDNSLGANITKLPESLTSIRIYAFYGKSNLALTELPKNITSIGSYAFQDCKNLLLNKLPDGVTSIGNSSFRNCNAITSLEIPRGLTSIPTYAFYNCNLMTVFRALGDISIINNYAFSGATVLERFELPNVTSVPTLNNTNIFRDTPIANGTGYVYVPDSLVDSFKTASNWSTYADQIKPISELEV